MNDLIKKLQALTAPCRECDAEIEIAIGLAELYDPPPHFGDGDIVNLTPKKNGKIAAINGQETYFHLYEPVSEYTSSIDTALTLVPEGWEWLEGHRSRRGGDYFGQTHVFRNLSDGEVIDGWHKLPAIAICIAALKALKSETK